MVTLFAELVLYLVVTAGVCAAALVMGKRTERMVAVGFLVTAAATVFVSTIIGRSHWHGVNWGVLAVDVVFLLWLIVVACRSERFWPLWAAAAQLAGTVAHLPAIAFPNLPMKLYAETQPFWAFPILACMLIGTIANRDRTPPR